MKQIVTITFQFHKGAIRTINGEIEDLVKRNFNSIKVRLEHPHSYR